MARRVVSEYINKNGLNVEDERRVYLEDYIQKRIEKNTLVIGDIIIIQEELIVEVFYASWELNEEQLNNLKNYSALVPSFN